VVICHESGSERERGFLPELADRLARAGFAVVSFDFSDSSVESQSQELGIVFEALRLGTIGVGAQAFALIVHDTGGAIALAQSAADDGVRALVTWAAEPAVGSGEVAVGVPWLRLESPVLEQGMRACVAWLVHQLP
jgi:hypothetical protein